MKMKRKMMLRPLRIQGRKRGSILIGVLWSLFVLGALAVAIYSYVFPHLSFAERMRDRVRSYYLAKAGVESALLAVKDEAEEPYESLKSPWSANINTFKDVPLGEGTFSIGHYYIDKNNEEHFRYGLVDEESKININKASKIVLDRVFEIAGKISKEDAMNIAAAIVDWRDSDDNMEDFGAESGYYMQLEKPYVCSNAPFVILEELFLVKGMSQEIFDNVKYYLTVYGYGKVNINTASGVVLQALGMNKNLAEKFVAYRNGGDGIEATGDDIVLESLKNLPQILSRGFSLTREDASQIRELMSSDWLAISSDHFMGNSIGILDEKKVLTKIVFIFGRDKVIRYWREY